MDLSSADKLFSHLPPAPQTPGFSILVLRGGETLYERQFGFASLEYGLPVTYNTVFHVASVSKQFTAACFTLLESEGLVNPDASIRRWFPELPACMEPVTPRHLLHHTGGLREQWDLFTLSGSSMEDLATSDQTLRALCRQKKLNFAPGERYQYCNSGYILLAQLVQRVTGQSLRQFAQDRIFGPLQMTSTYFRDDHGEVCRNRAESYEWEGGAYKHRALTFDVAGNTSLNTTARDLCRWLSELIRPQVFSPDVVRRIKEPFTLNGGPVSGYCRGIQHTRWRGQEVYFHSGANAGFRAVSMAIPDLDLRLAVLSNYGTSRPYQRALRLLEFLVPEALESLPAHNYRLDVDVTEPKGLFLCGAERAELMRLPNGVHLRDGTDWDFLRTGGNEYVNEAMDARLYPQPDGAVVLDPFAGETSVYRPADFVPVPDAERTASGMYLSDELLTFYRLSFAEDTLILEHLKRGTQSFRRRQNGTYVAVDGEPITLTLQSGTPASFTLDKQRSQGILFIKTDLAEE